AQRRLDRQRLGQVAGRRGRAVRIDVADLAGIDARVLDRIAHAARGALATLARRGHVVRVAAHAEADQLAVDARTARLGLVVVLEHEDARAVAHDEAVAALVPGPRGLLRLVVAGRQRLHRAEAAQRGRRGRVLGAAGDHRVGLAVLDHAHRQADVVGGRGARGDRGDVRTLGAGHDRDLAGDHVDDGAGHVERRDLARAALGLLERGLLDALQAADAGADGHADALGRLTLDRDAGIGDRHQRRSHAVVDEGIHLLDVLRRNPLRRVEAAHFARDPGRERGGVEVGDRADARAAVDDAVPAA